MKKVALAKIKDDFSRYLRIAGREGVVITRHGRPAGILFGFESDEDWIEFRLQNDPRFLKQVETARDAIRQGRGVPLAKLRKRKAST